jgi:hypothetical protein
MMHTASPLWQRILFFLFAPPIMAILIRLMSRGWAMTVQGGKISETTEKRQRLEFWIVLCFMYVMLLCIFLYGHFRAS